MNLLQQQQSFDDKNITAQCIEPKKLFQNEIPTSFTELCDQQAADLPTGKQNVKQLVDSTKNETSSALWGEAVPTPLVAIPLGHINDIQRLSDSGKGVEQVTHLEDRTGQPTVVDPEHQNSTSIDRQILCIVEPRTPQNVPSTQIKSIHTRRRGKKNRIPLLPFMQPEPSEQNEYDSKIPKGSTEFIYNCEIFSVNIIQIDEGPMIGRGNFGSVHLVPMNGLPNDRMVVKRIPIRKEEDGRSSAITEWATMEKIGSGSRQYIVDYYCSLINPAAKEMCICMEWMDTSVEKLYRSMHQLGNLAFDKLDPMVRRIAHDTAAGLYILEIKHIVHRDVKPANILINNHAVIKICDFGICANLNEESNVNIVVGTVAYLAPKPKPCALEGDMWAFGMTLKEIIDGKHPFADWLPGDIPFKILEWTPTVSTRVSLEMQQLILHLLEREAHQRPASHEDILNIPSIRNVPEIPSVEECNFVRRIIANIPSVGTSIP